MYNHTPQVTIIVVRGDEYEDFHHLPHLQGPTSDVFLLKNLLIEDTKTAIYNEDQFIEISNPTANELH